jgi:pyruvate kinase
MPTKETTTSRSVPRSRKVRILATLGPASDTPEMIRQLAEAGADAFRINMSHGIHEDHARRITAIRHPRPSSIGRRRSSPTCRVQSSGRPLRGRQGRGQEGPDLRLRSRRSWRFDPRQPPPPRDIRGVQSGARLLVDDGKLVFRSSRPSASAQTKVEVGGTISNNKGLNLPDVLLPMAALTEKDRKDLTFALEHGVDWIALSFVQRPEDVAEARRLIGGKAALLAKIEKPAAIERLEGILELADAVMVARGDLGVEMLPEEVPPLQKRIVEAARRLGRPVVVATQMLESMISTPSPTRAEVSDVATAVYDGADAIMLSAESASGQFPREAVGDDEPDRDQRQIGPDPLCPRSLHRDAPRRDHQ